MTRKQFTLGQTALMQAAQGGHAECVSLLLEHPGIDVNIGDNVGKL